MNARDVIVMLWPALCVAAVATLCVHAVCDCTRARREDGHFNVSRIGLRLHGINRRDIWLMLFITVAYAVIAFVGLGDMTAPQTSYRFSERKERALIEFDAPVDVSKIMVYTGGTTGTYHMTYRDSNNKYHDWEQELKQEHGSVFHWLEYLPRTNGEVGYTTLSGFDLMANQRGLELFEIAVFDRDGGLVDTSRMTLTIWNNDTAERMVARVTDAHPLLDEQDIVPQYPDYLNSMYFDEIYHVRTAREYLQTNGVYETTHPPLGKLIIALFINLFGLVPFVWRLPGVLCGILMVPLMYALVKRMFGKTWLAAAGTIWFSFDFMHYVQTRIATIDSYAVLFSMAMFYFMYVFVARGFDVPTKQRAMPLFLCGLSFGLGVASKWTCFYAAGGICVIYFSHLIASWARARREAYRSADASAEAQASYKRFLRRAAATLGLSVIFFVVIPAAIYYLSYFWFAKAQGQPLSWQIVWDNQTLMFNYHSQLTEPHVYQSSWYQWIINARPILYYLDSRDGLRSAFAAFLNPLVCWMGLAAIALLFGRLFRHATRPVRGLAIAMGAAAAVAAIPLILVDQAGSVKPEDLPVWMLGWVDAPPLVFVLSSRIIVCAVLGIFALGALHRREGVTLFILLAYLSQLLPWVLVSRATFNYHYFQSMPLLVLAICAVFDRWDDATKRANLPRAEKGRAPSRYATASTAGRAAVWYTLGVLLLFCMFYPAISGVYVPDWYSKYFTRWFFSWVA